MPSHRLIQSRLAARVVITKNHALDRAESAAQGVARDVARLWTELWSALQSAQGQIEAFQRARSILSRLVPLLYSSIAERLKGLAEWGHRASVKAVVGTLPVGYLAAAIRKSPASRSGIGRLYVPESKSSQATVKFDRLREDFPDSQGPGAIILQKLGKVLTVRNRLAPFLHGDLPDDEAKSLMSQILFPPPTQQHVLNIVNAPVADGKRWVDRLKTIQAGYSPDDVAGRIASGLSQGQTLRELAKELRPAIEGPRFRAMRIARTEGLRVAETMQKETHEALGDLLAGYQVVATLDQFTRASHAARHGLVWRRDSGVSMQAALKMAGPTLPDAPNSVLPGAWMQGRVISASKANYAGKVAELITASGRRVTVTVNHPILTAHGFVAAGLLHEGLQLVCYQPNAKGSMGWSDDVDQEPSTIENVFRAMDQSRSSILTPATGGQFHGDGRYMYGQVQIVTPEWELGDDFNSTTEKFADQFAFADTADLAACRTGDSNSVENRVGVFPSSRFLSAERRTASMVSGISLVPKARCLGSAAHLDAALQEPAGQNATADLRLLGNLQERFPSNVTLDKLVKIRKFDYRGHVYDLQTTTGHMVANCRNDGSGIFLSNCRCFLSPILAAPTISPAGLRTLDRGPVPDPATMVDWYAVQPERIQRQAVTSQRYSLVKDKIGSAPQWADFIDPEDGELLTVSRLGQETQAETIARRVEVQKQMLARRADTLRVRQRGFVDVQPQQSQPVATPEPVAATSVPAHGRAAPH